MTVVNQIELKKKLAGEIGNAVCSLANIAEDWNAAQEEPDERGPGNGAIGLIVFDDGSGWITEFDQSPTDDPLGNGRIIHHFKSPEEVVDWFFENISGRSLYGQGDKATT